MDQNTFAVPMHTDEEIRRVTGLSVYTLQNWMARPGLSLGKNPGSGKKRKYSALDCVHLYVRKLLVDRGYSASAAAEAARHVDEYVANISDPQASECLYVLVGRYEDGTVHTSFTDQKSCLLIAVEKFADPAPIVLDVAAILKHVYAGLDLIPNADLR